MGLLILDGELDGECLDIRCTDGRVSEIGRRLRPAAGDEVLTAGGGVVLPGLHDHHVHLLAMAAAASSVVMDSTGVDEIARRHRIIPAGTWLRAVGYHESISGLLDRDGLEALAPGRPVRVQHRSGAMWVLSSTAVEQLGVDQFEAAGVERDSQGRATGRLYGLDWWLRGKAPRVALDLRSVSRQLSGYGVTGVTDATPTDDAEDLRVLADARRRQDLMQRVTVTGGLRLDPLAEPQLSRGPVKLIVADHSLPDVSQLAADIARSHDQQRPVALHCVTRVALVIALAAWQEVGAWSGDRVEHGGVIGPEQAAMVRELGLTVVTQPNFVAERGDQYRIDVDPEDQPYLYPCGSLLERGVPVGGSTDAPYGHADPWKAMTAAVTRSTESGHVLGGVERVDGARALALFLGPPQQPGGPVRRVEVGAPADLCVMARPWREVVVELDAALVLATVLDGQLVRVEQH